jgi:hypothetical protein
MVLTFDFDSVLKADCFFTLQRWHFVSGSSSVMVFPKRWSSSTLTNKTLHHLTANWIPITVQHKIAESYSHVIDLNQWCNLLHKSISPITCHNLFIYKYSSQGFLSCGAVYCCSKIPSFCPEDGGSTILQNIGIILQHCMLSQPRRLYLEFSLSWKPQSSHCKFFYGWTHTFSLQQT